MADPLEIAESVLDGIMSDLWSFNQLNNPLDKVTEKVMQLKIQLEVQKALQTTASLLLQQPMDQPLPKHQAVRVKHLMKFVFEKASREKDKQVKLKGLECSSLIFLGLSYNVKTLYEMPMPQFDFLVGNVGDYIQRHELNKFLYRNDIDRVVNCSQLEPEDDDLLKDFLKKRIELRPSKRKFPEIEQSTPNSGSPKGADSGLRATVMLNNRDREEKSYDELEAPRLGIGIQRTLSPMSKEKREMKFMFTNAPATSISTLPEPFRTAVMNSRLWKWERSQNLSSTGCLATLFPKDVTQDVSFTIWCGHNDGYHLNNDFCFQRAMSS